MVFLSAFATTHAAIIYSGLKDIVIPTGFDGIYLDIQTGATSTGEFGGWDFNPFFGGYGVANSPDFQPARASTSNESAIVRYNAGTLIGTTAESGLLYSTDYGGSDSHLGAGSTQFGIGQEGYLAFRLITNGGLSNLYGWVRVIFSANVSAEGRIVDWAYEDSGSAMTAGRVRQSAPSAGVQLTTFSPAVGESFTHGSLVGNPGSGNIGSILKTGAGTTILTANHSFTGETTVSGGVLEVGNGGKLSGTSKVTVNLGGTLLFSGAGSVNGRVNGGATVTLAGGKLSTLGLTSTLDQQFGALTLSQTSTVDFSLLAAGQTLRFAASSGSTWAPGQTLRIVNYTGGVDRIFFGANSGGLTVSQLNAIQFYSDNGVTLLNSTAPAFIGALGEIAPVPEPTALLTVLALCGWSVWREGRGRRRRVPTKR